MTAVASPPTLQPLPRWNSGDEREGLDSMSTEEVTRMFMPRKSIQRTNSSSSMASSSSSTPSSSTSTSVSTAPSATVQINGSDAPASTGEQGGWGPRKKAARGLWPSSKAEPVSGISTARPQALPTPSSGQSAASTMNSAMHQPSPILPSQNRLQSQSQSQQNGSRSDTATNSADPPAILALSPVTNTFEKKQIVVPYFPEVLRIGRQTNAKTVPTAVNGYFDSKVLSRQHAEVWAERNGKIWIRDVKSSNGTFVNGIRLSPENRDSEPRELQERDTLELGIDIVSEDQKSIVHHKVSAKVELAGIYPNPPSSLEMELNHHNLNGSNGIMGDPMSQQLQNRGRGGNQGSISGNGRMPGAGGIAGNNLNMIGPRQMNMWMGPITIEQVVKKLNTELKTAKQQSQDLNRTGEFFNTLLNLQPGEELPESPSKAVAEEKQANGVVPPPAQLDPISPFTQPPAPPPQQPLPEKPDVARLNISESLSQPSLKRTETERPRSGLGSPSRVESGQIISLVEALKIKTNELDSKVDYIKSLEVDLARERRARENAERRALKLSSAHLDSNEDHDRTPSDEGAYEPPLDSVELMEHELPNSQDDSVEDGNLSRSSSMSTIRHIEEADQPVEDATGLASRLQAQLDLRTKEMNDMKMLMESYRQRAEEAEEGRRTLAQMVEDIRAGRDPKSALPTSKTAESKSPTEGTNAQVNHSGKSSESKNADSNIPSQNPQSQQNGSAMIGNIQREIEKTMSNVLQQQQQQQQGAWPGDPDQNGRMVQSAPYISMVGVVLIGVGLMTWLNGWQPNGDK